MRWILFLLSAGAFVIGLVGSAMATTIFQQISGLIALVIWAVLFSAAGIVDAIVNLKQQINQPVCSGSAAGQSSSGQQKISDTAATNTGNRIAWLVLALVIIGAAGYALLKILYAV